MFRIAWFPFSIVFWYHVCLKNAIVFNNVTVPSVSVAESNTVWHLTPGNSAVLMAVRMEHTSFSKPRSSSLREKYDDSQLELFFMHRTVHTAFKCTFSQQSATNSFPRLQATRGTLSFFLQYAKCHKNKHPLSIHNRRITAPCVLLRTSVMRRLCNVYRLYFSTHHITSHHITSHHFGMHFEMFHKYAHRPNR